MKVDAAVYTTEEVCNIFKIRREVLYKLVKAKKISSIKLGGELRFPKELIDKLLVIE